jgi:hypothetical protein
LVRAGEIEHRGHPLAFPVRLVAQRRPELGSFAWEQPGQLLSHLFGDQDTEPIHIQLHADACGLTQDFGHRPSFLSCGMRREYGGRAAGDAPSCSSWPPHSLPLTQPMALHG